MLSAIYGRRPPRRPARGVEQLRATRRSRPFRLPELGAWASRKSDHAAAAPQPGRARANVPALVRAAATLTSPGDPERAGKLAIDWPLLLAAGYPDPRSPNAQPLKELHRMAGPLVRQAFAENAGPRDRVVLVTSATPAEGRTFIAISLALSLARHRAILLVDADPGPAGIAARFGLGAAKGLNDSLADPDLQPDRLTMATELERLALLAPGGSRSDLLELIASRRTIGLLRDLLAADPARLILIDGPPLCQPEGQALALFAGQVVLVVAAGATPRDAVATALARLGDRANVSLLLNRAPATESQAAADRPRRTRPR